MTDSLALVAERVEVHTSIWGIDVLMNLHIKWSADQYWSNFRAEKCAALETGFGMANLLALVMGRLKAHSSKWGLHWWNCKLSHLLTSVGHVSEQRYVLPWKQGKDKSDDCAGNVHGQSKGRLGRELIISPMVSIWASSPEEYFSYILHLYDL